MREHPVDVGHRSEIAVLHHLTRRGFVDYQPVSVNCRCDVLIDVGSRFVRVQCKTARVHDGYLLFLARSIRSNRRETLLRTYQGEIDLFFAYCEARDEVYVVPVEEATRSEVRLRLAPPANNQMSRIRWAKDYLLDVMAPVHPCEAPKLTLVSPE
jgi:PD-(D/E)XK endonuclease